MKRTLCALAVAVAMSVAAYGTSHAVPIAPLPAAQTDSSAITPVHYRYHHYYYHRYWHPYRYYGWQPYRYYWGLPVPVLLLWELSLCVPAVPLVVVMLDADAAGIYRPAA